MIIVLSGPLGCGKTSTSDSILNTLSSHRCIVLHGDHICEGNDVDVTDTVSLAAHYDRWIDTVALLVDHHGRQGYTHIVVEYVLDINVMYTLRARLSTTAVGVRGGVFTFLLDTPIDENHRRIRTRSATQEMVDEENIQWELSRATYHRDLLHQHPAGQVVSAIGDVTSVARRIVDYCRQSTTDTQQEIHFLSEFVDWIVSGKKRATTRWRVGNPKEGVLPTVGDTITGITCNSPFCILRIDAVRDVQVDHLTEDDAAVENFTTAADLQNVLHRIYPLLMRDSVVTVLHFTCLHIVPMTQH